MSITTEEQRREEMERIGFRPLGKNGTGWVNTDLARVRVYEVNGNKGANVMTDMNSVDLADLVRAAAILQIPIPGYRIVREEGAPGVNA